MRRNTEGAKDVLLNRLRRIEDDIERLSSFEQTPEIAATIAALVSEAGEIEVDISRLRETAALPDKIKEVRALRYKGLSLDQIAEKTGIGKATASRYCRDIPVDRRQHVKPRLVRPDWLDAATAMKAQGKSRHVIANELGIPLANFYRAFNRFVRD